MGSKFLSVLGVMVISCDVLIFGVLRANAWVRMVSVRYAASFRAVFGAIMSLLCL